MIKRLIKFMRGWLPLALVASMLAALIPMPVFADTLYESYDGVDDTSGGVYAAYYEAQTFTPGADHYITSVQLKIYRIGTPNNYIIDITTTASDKPTATVLATVTQGTNAVTTDTAGEWVTFTFATPAALTSGTKYAIKVHKETAGDGSNTCRWRLDSALATYAGGDRCESTDSATSWTVRAAQDFKFKEYGCVAPTVVSGAVSSVEETTATVGGNITSLGGATACTKRGVDYDIDTGAPYASENYDTGSYAAGAYTINLVGLTKGELYYWRAKALNGAGWGVSAESATTFLTKPDEPTNLVAVATGATEITLTWTKGTGADDTIVRGKDGGYPANIADGYEVYNGAGVTDADTLLTAGHTYYYRAWSYTTEGGKEQWSDTYDEILLLLSAGATVNTLASTGFGSDYIIARGEVTDPGDTSITEVAFEYGLTTAYGSSISTPVSFVTGEFEIKITGLTPATIYHYRAKAKNSDGDWNGVAANDIICATHGSDSIYEFFNTADDADVDTYGHTMYGQTFTTGATVPHTVAQVRVEILRVGAPGILYGYIYRTSAGEPTGLPIGQGDIDADVITDDADGLWYSIVLDEEIALDTGTVYALVLAAPNATAAAYVAWNVDTANGYADGTEVSSTDGGTSWSATAANDMMFEIWGNPAISIQSARVFSNYIETGDQLYVFSYKAIADTSHENTDPRLYFNTQLELAGTTEAQGKLSAWGYKVGSIYIAPTETLPWGDNVTVKLNGITGSDYASNTASYIMSGKDWAGADLNTLDDWVINTAMDMETYYGIALTTYTEGKQVLNETGGTIFTIGIPSLPDERPGLFGTDYSVTTPVPGTHAETYQAELTGNFGATATAAFADIGELLGVSGGFMSGAFWFYIVIIGIAVTGAVTGNPTVGFLVAIPLLFVGNFMGVIPLAMTLVPTFIMGAYVAYILWLKGT